MLSFIPGICLRAGAIFALLFGPASATLDFDTYRVIKKNFRVTRDGLISDSTEVTYELTRLGSVSLEASSLTLTSHGSYLSVIEEATLTGNVENRPHDITGDFLLQGSLPIPPLAAVHSLSVRHGDTLFQAQLKRMTYSLNDFFLDTTALKATLSSRVAFLQQLTDQSFEATFSKIALGEPVRVRIEYDIPFPGGPGEAITIPVLFHPSGSAPRQSQITFFENAGNLPSVQWLSSSGRVTLSSPGTHTVSYQRAFSFVRNEALVTAVTLQASTFESGRLKGDYLLFKGGLNDSLMDLLSRPLETVFLWRWNPPYAFVEMRDGLKTLSDLGKLAVLEAGTLRQIIQEMTPRGHRFGLYRSAPGYKDVSFGPAGEGEEGLDKIVAYLEGFTEARIYAEYKDYKSDSPGWVAGAWSDSGEIANSKNMFLGTLRLIRQGFSDNPESLKHIEMIGLGTASSTLIDLKDPAVVEKLMDTVTISNVLAPWLGVDMDQALKYKANENLRPLTVESPLAKGLGALHFPVFQPTSVEYRAFTASRSHSVVLPFNRGAEREAMFKASGPFGDTLQLQGIDALGRKTRTLTLKPRILRIQSDTGMARLWAADPDRIAEESEVDLGMRYGILTKGTYWGAGIETATTQTPGTGTPILLKVAYAGSRQGFRVVGNMLRVEFAEAEKGQTRRLPDLEVYDLRGRLIFRISLDRYRVLGGFAIPLDVFGRCRLSKLVLVLRVPGNLQSFSLKLGGKS